MQQQFSGTGLLPCCRSPACPLLGTAALTRAGGGRRVILELLIAQRSGMRALPSGAAGRQQEAQPGRAALTLCCSALLGGNPDGSICICLY